MSTYEKRGIYHSDNRLGRGEGEALYIRLLGGRERATYDVIHARG